MSDFQVEMSHQKSQSPLQSIKRFYEKVRTLHSLVNIEIAKGDFYRAFHFSNTLNDAEIYLKSFKCCFSSLVLQ
jgi:hypothetical protein